MDAFIGTIIAWAPNFAPQGWLFCNGQLLPINQYQAVFALLGTTYGGDGRTNFALPNLNGRVPLGAQMGGALAPGQSVHPLGTVGGQESVVPTLPAHTHAATATAGTLACAATTTVAVSKLTSGTVTPVDNASLGGTVAGTPPSAAIYLPPTTPPGATVKLGGVSTAITVTGAPAVAVAPAGATAPMSVMNPYQAINFIMCVEGLFPSRP